MRRRGRTFAAILCPYSRAIILLDSGGSVVLSAPCGHRRFGGGNRSVVRARFDVSGRFRSARFRDRPRSGFMMSSRFRDRTEAGALLGQELARTLRDNRNVVVLGLPRGGVPVAAEVARALDAPLDVFIVRKL